MSLGLILPEVRLQKTMTQFVMKTSRLAAFTESLLKTVRRLSLTTSLIRFSAPLRILVTKTHEILGLHPQRLARPQRRYPLTFRNVRQPLGPLRKPLKLAQEQMQKLSEV